MGAPGHTPVLRPRSANTQNLGQIAVAPGPWGMKDPTVPTAGSGAPGVGSARGPGASACPQGDAAGEAALQLSLLGARGTERVARGQGTPPHCWLSEAGHGVTRPSPASHGSWGSGGGAGCRGAWPGGAGWAWHCAQHVWCLPSTQRPPPWRAWPSPVSFPPAHSTAGLLALGQRPGTRRSCPPEATSPTLARSGVTVPQPQLCRATRPEWCRCPRMPWCHSLRSCRSGCTWTGARARHAQLRRRPHLLSPAAASSAGARAPCVGLSALHPCGGPGIGDAPLDTEPARAARAGPGLCLPHCRTGARPSSLPALPPCAQPQPDAAPLGSPAVCERARTHLPRGVEHGAQWARPRSPPPCRTTTPSAPLPSSGGVDTWQPGFPSHRTAVCGAGRRVGAGGLRRTGGLRRAAPPRARGCCRAGQEGGAAEPGDPPGPAVPPACPVGPVPTPGPGSVLALGSTVPTPCAHSDTWQ